MLLDFYFLNKLKYLYQFFFFFQAEDGIRDLYVTGVQTCAFRSLPARRWLRQRWPVPAARAGCAFVAGHADRRAGDARRAGLGLDARPRPGLVGSGRRRPGGAGRDAVLPVVPAVAAGAGRGGRATRVARGGRCPGGDLPRCCLGSAGRAHLDRQLCRCGRDPACRLVGPPDAGGAVMTPPHWWPTRWRSPVRGPWFTAVLGLTLLITLPLVISTGLLSYIAYGPQFGQAAPGRVGWLHLPYFDWPTRPAWLYQLTQGVHVGLGLVLIPVVLAKLWSVLPKLFTWPPARSPAQLLERLSLGLLVGGILFEIVTGVLNIQYDYIFGFRFYTAHYIGGWVFTAAFVAHVTIKLPRMWRAVRHRMA